MRKKIVALTAAIMLVGCSGVGVIASSDPRVKVGQAEEMQRQGRYFRAKQLLDEAYEIVRQNGDEAGIAEVCRGYGICYRDGSGSDDVILAAPGTKLSTGTGFAKAQEYFSQAIPLFEKHEIYDKVSNVHFLMAQVFYRMNDKANACKSLDESLKANKLAVAANPNLRLNLTPGIASFDEGINRARREVGCPS